jgi:ubiquinone/menaquinone biosynthesis C-methylase UbiE
MSDTSNLTPTEWSDVLLSSVQPSGVARELQNGQVSPWTTVLQDYTRDVDTVLDLGSGRGQHSATLALTGKATTLLDWSRENLDFSMKLFDVLRQPGRFCRADMLKPLPFVDNAFDAVFSCGVFEYFTDREITVVLREAFRVARQRVIIMVPNASSVAYRVGKFYMEKRGTWHWGGERPHSSLKPYFHDVGCHQVEELSVAAKTSLEFLTMRGGDSVRKALVRLFKLTDHAQRASFRQGYLLISVGDKR